MKLIDGIVLSEPPRAASNSAFVQSLDNSKLILSIDKNFAKIARPPALKLESLLYDLLALTGALFISTLPHVQSALHRQNVRKVVPPVE